MAIEIQYVVIHNGEEKMVTADKKEANEYDKMLGIADNLSEFIEQNGIHLDEKQAEELSIMLAKNKDAVTKLLRGVALETVQNKQ